MRILFLVNLTGLVIGFSSPSLYAQVSNNNIEGKINLALDKAFTKSTTENSTVQWSCVNKILTDKCVIHHNDQWFDFSITKPGTYFINISSQECRDKRGIQAIVIEGDPCKSKNYRVMRCVSKIRQEDVFIRMDSLKPGINYLVNIDGFLADKCTFEIQFSTVPAGLPQNIEKPDTLIRPISHGDSLFKLKWHVRKAQIDGIDEFRIYRSLGYSKAKRIYSQSVARNALGASSLDYQLIDTLNTEGDYKYFIYGVQKDTQTPHLLVEQEVRYGKALPKLEKETSVTISLDYPEKMPFQILIYDLSTDQMVRSSRHEFESVRDRNFEIDLSDLLNKGITKFLILASNDRRALEFYFTMTSSGRFVKR